MRVKHSWHWTNHGTCTVSSVPIVAKSWTVNTWERMDFLIVNVITRSPSASSVSIVIGTSLGRSFKPVTITTSIQRVRDVPNVVILSVTERKCSCKEVPFGTRDVDQELFLESLELVARSTTKFLPTLPLILIHRYDNHNHYTSYFMRTVSWPPTL